MGRMAVAAPTEWATALAVSIALPPPIPTIRRNFDPLLHGRGARSPGQSIPLKMAPPERRTARASPGDTPERSSCTRSLRPRSGPYVPAGRLRRSVRPGPPDPARTAPGKSLSVSWRLESNETVPQSREQSTHRGGYNLTQAPLSGVLTRQESRSYCCVSLSSASSVM